MSNTVEKKELYELDFDQTYNLLLWTPWDSRYLENLDKNLVEELENMPTEFKVYA